MRLLTTSNGDLPFVKIILNQDDTISYESNVANTAIQDEIRRRGITDRDLEEAIESVYRSLYHAMQRGLGLTMDVVKSGVKDFFRRSNG